MTTFSETEERQELRRQVAKLGSKYGREYFMEKGRAGEKTTELWLEIGKNGYLGINIPEEYGGGSGGIGDVAAVCEELAAQGCPLLLMVVSPAICGTIISRYGTDEQKQRWLPGICDGTGTMAFAITEPDAGTNTHNISTVARKDGDEWVLNGRKIFISGVDEADNVLVVARTEDAKTGKVKPVLFVVPTDAAGFEAKAIPMEWTSPELQFAVFIDDLRLPGDALVGDEDGGLVQLFAGLNPERIMAASFSTGLARFALDKATAYAKERVVFQGPIGSHQAIAHPLAESHIEIEMARLMTQKAAALYDAGDDMAAGEAANMAKYAAAEAACNAADRAVQTHGGNGATQEYGVAGLLVATRVGRIAPVSREMILNFVAMHSLGLPKSVLTRCMRSMMAFAQDVIRSEQAVAPPVRRPARRPRRRVSSPADRAARRTIGSKTPATPSGSRGRRRSGRSRRRSRRSACTTGGPPTGRGRSGRRRCAGTSTRPEDPVVLDDPVVALRDVGPDDGCGGLRSGSPARSCRRRRATSAHTTISSSSPARRARVAACRL